MDPLENFSLAGVVAHRGLNIVPGLPRPGRHRNSYGDGPFARLATPRLPVEPGVYIWWVNGNIVYVGQTRTTANLSGAAALARCQLNSRGFDRRIHALALSTQWLRSGVQTARHTGRSLNLTSHGVGELQ